MSAPTPAQERYAAAVRDGTAAEIDAALAAVHGERPRGNGYDRELPPIEAYANEDEAPANPTTRKEADNKAPELRGEDFADMTPRFNIAASIKGLLAPQSFAAIIGPSGCGKTFFGTDLACHVAASLPYRVRKVVGGLVVYGALEGAASARNRFYAWRQRYLRERSAALPLRAMIDAINLRDPIDVLRMIEFIRAAESDHGAKVSLVFIDTLNRAMAGGNENAPDDMGALIRGADAMRLHTGATVVLIHHSGKDESRGARGHTSLFAALDTELTIRVSGDQRIATVTKQRDWPGGDELAFRLERVELGHDADGDPITSCVVVPCEATAATDSRRQPSGKNQVALLAALQEWHRAHPAAEIITSVELLAIAKAQDMNRKRLAEAVDGLEKFGWLQPSVGGHKFISEAAP